MIGKEKKNRSDSRNFSDREFFPASERNGYNFGKAIITMIYNFKLSESDEVEFLRGINKSLFKELKSREVRRNRRDERSENERD